MSNNTKTWVVGLVGVAVGAILAVTIFLISQPPAAREQVTGAIGAAERFRTEQIKEGDTGITGGQASGAAGQVTMDELANLLGVQVFAENATVQEKAEWAKSASAAELSEALGRAPRPAARVVLENATQAERFSAVKHLEKAEQAKAFSEVRPSEQVAVFNNLVASERKPVLAAMGLTEAQWANLTQEQQSKNLNRIAENNKADLFVRCSERTVAEAFTKLEAKLQFRALSAAGVMHDIVARCDSKVKAEVFDAATLESKAQWWKGLSVEQQRTLVERVGQWVKQERIDSERVNTERTDSERGVRPQ
jgi:hypothetical protein